MAIDNNYTTKVPTGTTQQSTSVESTKGKTPTKANTPLLTENTRIAEDALVSFEKGGAFDDKLDEGESNIGKKTDNNGTVTKTTKLNNGQTATLITSSDGKKVTEMISDRSGAVSLQKITKIDSKGNKTVTIQDFKNQKETTREYNPKGILIKEIAISHNNSTNSLNGNRGYTASDNKETIEYDKSGNIAKRTSENKSHTVFTDNKDVRNDSCVTTTEYDSSGKKTSETTKIDNTETRKHYDPSGKMFLEIILDGGRETTRNYDSSGKITKETIKTDNTDTIKNYDSSGKITKETTKTDDKVTIKEYDSSGKVTSEKIEHNTVQK